MRLLLRRDEATPKATPGSLFLNDTHLCRTLEDEWQPGKVMGETRIPGGIYVVVLRPQGGLWERFRQRDPIFAHGMLHLLDVPGFTYVLIHPGNTKADTEGCILVGRGVTYDAGEPKLLQSLAACVELYERVVPGLIAGEPVTIAVEGRDGPAGAVGGGTLPGVPQN